MYWIVVISCCVILLITMSVAASRYAKRRRASGDWDEQGPKHPTLPPAEFLNPFSSRSPLDDLAADPEKRDPSDSHRDGTPS